MHFFLPKNIFCLLSKTTPLSPEDLHCFKVFKPTVGLKTLIQCRRARLKGIVLKSKQNVFLEQKKCINFANKNKMFITVK